MLINEKQFLCSTGLNYTFLYVFKRIGLHFGNAIVNKPGKV
jgi:hypothetical protein